MSNLSVFNFESHEVRFVGTADNPLWVAQDICKILELNNVSMAIAKLDDDEKLTSLLVISGQRRETLCINTIQPIIKDTDYDEFCAAIEMFTETEEEFNNRIVLEEIYRCISAAEPFYWDSERNTLCEIGNGRASAR
ncbi:hypothetical protein LC612_09380 [Nostoc sp. CHAB 5834]|nr:hypothetical protein [Nostoc sp. CHAB 5834]